MPQLALLLSAPLVAVFAGVLVSRRPSLRRAMVAPAIVTLVLCTVVPLWFGIEVYRTGTDPVVAAALFAACPAIALFASVSGAAVLLRREPPDRPGRMLTLIALTTLALAVASVFIGFVAFLTPAWIAIGRVPWG